MKYPLVKISKKKYEYPDAGDNAHPEVQKLIEEFRSLPEEERATKPLLYWLLGSGTPPYKMSKDDSEYTDESEKEDQTCGNCYFMFQSLGTGNYICSQVFGPVKKAGWCKLWKPTKIK